MNREDFTAPFFVGHANHNFPVKPARSAQSLVNSIRPVRGRNHNDVGARLQPVHQGEQLRDKAFFRLARHAVAFGSDRIYFVNKDNRRRVFGRILKHLTQAFFALAIA